MSNSRQGALAAAGSCAPKPQRRTRPRGRTLRAREGLPSPEPEQGAAARPLLPGPGRVQQEMAARPEAQQFGDGEAPGARDGGRATGHQRLAPSTPVGRRDSASPGFSVDEA